ncbi:MAG: TldD/PmbA family protein, partial [Thermoprotei archaeon]
MHEELLQHVIDEGLRLGAQYVEARHQRNIIRRISCRNGEVLALESDVREGIAIRVLYEGSVAFAAVSSVRQDEVMKALERAIALARSAKPLLKLRYGLSEDRVGRTRYNVYVKKRFEDIDVGVKIAELRKLWRSANDAVRESKLGSMYVSYIEENEEKSVVTSDGAFIESHIPRLYMHVNMVLNNNSKGTLQRFLEFGGAGGFEIYEQWRAEDKVGDEAKRLERVLLKGVEPPKEPIDVVLGSEIVGLVVHESAGHPM